MVIWSEFSHENRMVIFHRFLRRLTILGKINHQSAPPPSATSVSSLGNSLRSSKRLPISKGIYGEHGDPTAAPFIAPSVHHWIVFSMMTWLVVKPYPSEKYELSIGIF